MVTHTSQGLVDGMVGGAALASVSLLIPCVPRRLALKAKLEA